VQWNDVKFSHERSEAVDDLHSECQYFPDIRVRLVSIRPGRGRGRS